MSREGKMEHGRNESQGREGRGQGPGEGKGRVSQEVLEELHSEPRKMPM